MGNGKIGTTGFVVEPSHVVKSNLSNIQTSQVPSKKDEEKESRSLTCSRPSYVSTGVSRSRIHWYTKSLTKNREG